MEHALVTGGCGFLGSEIVRQLVARGVRVRVLALPSESDENIADLDVEILRGDVRSIEAVTAAVRGVDTVFHCAAIYKDWAPDPSSMYDVNARGTFHVLEAARRAGVARVIYTASIVSLGRPPVGALGDESTAYEAWDQDFAYSRSKFQSRELAEYFGAWGMDVRVVCPGAVFGPGDLRPTPSGQLILTSMGMPGPAIAFDGGASYVDVRDAARVHVEAAERGRAGERYIATAHNLTNLELVRAIDRVTGRKRPVAYLPLPLARATAIAMDEVARRTGKPPLIARSFFEYALRPAYYSNAKSIRELGVTYRPLDETIADAVAWFRKRGIVR